MSIHKTPNDKFQVRWREGGRHRARTFRRKIDAQQLEARIRLGEALILSKEGSAVQTDVTFSQFSEIWLETHASVHKATSSVIKDKQILRDYLLPSLGTVSLTDISKRDVVNIQAKLCHEQRLKPSTINNVMALCQKILADAVNWGYLKVNPTQGLKRIRHQPNDYRIWTLEERDRFLEFVKNTKPILYEVVAFAVLTGLRRGEVEGLKRDCLDFKARMITVKRSYCHKTRTLNEYTKGKNIRRVPMNYVVYRLLLQYSLSMGDQKIFTCDFGHLVWRHFKPAQIEAGVPVITFHDLRHSFASHLAMKGLSVFDIKNMLGHTDIKTTMRYMHHAPDHLKGATDCLIGTMEHQALFQGIGPASYQSTV